MDNRIYNAYRESTGKTLELDEIFAIKTPLSLGGELKADNFQIENIVAYYKSTAEIYKDIEAFHVK